MKAVDNSLVHKIVIQHNPSLSFLNSHCASQAVQEITTFCLSFLSDRMTGVSPHTEFLFK